MARSSGGTASTWARLSPELTTKSGSSSASERTHSIFLVWPGVRCRSLTCRMRTGALPGGRAGTAYRRSVNQVRSTSAA